MVETSLDSDAPLRVFCIEDNPLIVFHLEQMIEDLGHLFVGSVASFADLQANASAFKMDCALVDIDLADGPTGPEAVSWLAAKGIPSIFVTGQSEIARDHSIVAVSVVAKPINEEDLASALALLQSALN